MFKRSLAVFAVVMVVVKAATGKDWRETRLNGKQEKAVYTSLKEKRQPVFRSECQPNEFSCSLDACIPLDEVCDTHRDCPGGDDEQNCPTNCTGSHQFKCENSAKCIGLVDKCDGHQDCPDYSDEAFCESFECRGGKFKCETSNECINSTSVCNNRRDCEDASDEQNCLNRTCTSYEFKCADNSKCIPHAYVCDYVHDCNDLSDEKNCSCPSQNFKCPNGICIPPAFKCDGVNDCGDLTEELDCPTQSPSVCQDVLTFEDCRRVNETSHPICLISDDANKFCRKFCGICQ